MNNYDLHVLKAVSYSLEKDYEKAVQSLEAALCEVQGKAEDARVTLLKAMIGEFKHLAAK